MLFVLKQLSCSWFAFVLGSERVQKVVRTANSRRNWNSIRVSELILVLLIQSLGLFHLPKIAPLLSFVYMLFCFSGIWVWYILELDYRTVRDSYISVFELWTRQIGVRRPHNLIQKAYFLVFCIDFGCFERMLQSFDVTRLQL